MSDSEHKFDEELISAYLDGELSDAERARVEQALSEDARCRRTWNDLRAIRESLQSLPTHQTGPDFQDNVLRQIDIVARRRHDGPTDAADHETVEATGSDTTVSRPMRNWHGTVWMIGTVAAAAVLLIVLMIPDQPKVADLAQNDTTRAASEKRESSDGISRAEPASDAQPSLEAEGGSFERKAEEFSEDSRVLIDDSLGVADSEAFQLDSADTDVASGGRGREKAAPMAPRPTSDARQGMLRTEEAPKETATSPLSRPQPARKLAGVTQEGLSWIAADGPSAELIASAMQQNNAKYLVHVVVNRSDTGSQAFARSLANNEIHYKKQAELHDLASRLLGRSEATRRSGQSVNEREELANQVEQDHATRQTARAETPQLVIVEVTATRLRDTVNELIRDRHEFQTVDVYEVASEDDSIVELRTDDKLWRFRRAFSFGLEQSGLGMAADESNSATGSLKADLNLSEALDTDALDSIEEADEAGAAGQSTPPRNRARGLDIDRYGKRLDSQAVRTKPDIAVQRLAEPSNRAVAGGAGGAGSRASDRPAASLSDQAQLGLTAPTLAKRASEEIRGIQGSVHVLFVLSPSLQTQIPSITAAEPVTREIGPVEPVAEPDENR